MRLSFVVLIRLTAIIEKISENEMEANVGRLGNAYKIANGWAKNAFVQGKYIGEEEDEDDEEDQDDGGSSTEIFQN
uniref:Uncharacterized protein n=1 Tax=Globodera rostochiensis TaxID=31243 RepID=A0A914GW52_GLORO